MIEAETGHPTEVAIDPTWQQLAAELKAGKRNLAGFVGYEFAWAREKDPRVLPLMVILNEKTQLVAHVLARKDGGPDHLAGLAGKAVALPSRSRPHCQLFLERQCAKLGKPVNEYLGKLLAPTNSEDALDDVVDGLADAVVVEDVALEAYQRRKPGRFAQLKEIARSEPFPPIVVAYYQGGLDDKTLGRFREGMLNLNETVEGRRVLTLWRMTAFENIPKDFEPLVGGILKAYPER
jgi:ABC-type phosphate/phosphonate transport system substrate-binding protein